MNLNYLFHVEYYNDLKFAHFNNCNRRIIKHQFKPSATEQIQFAKHCFMLKTMYPGLLFGLGNDHGAGTDFVGGDSKDGAEIKLGFTLDFVTGLPVIPGSTVKGVLRSAFKNHPEYVADLMKVDIKTVKKVENSVFGKEEIGTVVFFDVIPIKTNKDNRIFGLENITPHKAENPAYDGLIDPTPLTLLKVIPGVSFVFRFGFDRWNEKVLSAEQVKTAFKHILIDLGIGAKTNVGFGGLADDEDEVPATILIPVETSETFGQKQQQKGYIKGKCRTCGKETKINQKTGQYYDYCYEHNPFIKR